MRVLLAICACVALAGCQGGVEDSGPPLAAASPANKAGMDPAASAKPDRESPNSPGPLVIIGGGLLPNNSAIYERLIADAGGRRLARFVVFPTASVSPRGAESLKRQLVARGVAAEQIEIVPVFGPHAAQAAEDPAVVDHIDRATAIFFTGGDQRRITQALCPNGRASPALAAIERLRSRGGLVAGSSAGAAVQSDHMLCVSGLPDDSLDEGLDALDFGLVESLEQPACRGLCVTRGLGFFQGGLIDQHFSQYRGRLARLARAAIENKIPFGVGIDENTALAVSPEGGFEVLGAGCVTLVQVEGATCEDSPLGCRMAGVLVSCLQHGDRFHPKRGVQAHASKEPIAPGDETNNGNFLIPDIAGPETVPHALIDGLGDNTSRRQVGIALKFNRHYGHGYRFTFHKTSHSRALAGDVEGVWSYTVTGIRLDIEPVSQSLRDPKSALPGDLADAPSSTRPALEAIWFRGILTADDQNRFRPGDAISRGELASAVAQTICLSPPRESLPIADVDAASPLADDVARVVKAGIMPLTPEGAFKPSRPVDPQTARAIFTRLCELYRGEKPSLPPFESEHITRTETAVALYKIIGFPW